MDTRAACLIEITGRATTKRAFPFALQRRDGTTTVSMSGFAVADRTLICAGAVFSKFESRYEIVACFNGRFDRVRCELVAIEHVPSLRRYARRLTNGDASDFRIGWSDSALSFSCIALLRSENAGTPFAFSTTDLHPGDPVHVISSPFGSLCPSVFQNSVSAGCIFNVSEGGDFAFVDTRCLPGSEGGAVLDCRGKVVGMLALFMHRLHDSVVISIAIRSSALIKILSNYGIDIAYSHHPVHLSVYQSCERYLVSIHIGTSWCTGVIVEPCGYAVTSAHLFKPYMDSEVASLAISVQVRSCNFAGSKMQCSTLRASLVYISKGPWDLALIKIQTDQRLYSVLDNAGLASASTGMEIMVIGFSLFHPDCLGQNQPSGPSTSRGLVSKVIRIDGRPIMIQSSATVHSGNSGGALVDAKTGALLGIVTCNAKQWVSESSSLVIPTLNFSIPEWVVEKVIEFLKSRDEVILRQLDDDDSEIKRIWSLSRKALIVCKL